MNKAQNLKTTAEAQKSTGGLAGNNDKRKTIGQYIHRGRTIYTHTGGEQGIGDTINTGENPGSAKTKSKTNSAYKITIIIMIIIIIIIKKNNNL